MEAPVNFENLRNITGGDKALEAVLFKSFLHSTEECLQKLHTALDASNEAQWRQQAHAFKGACMNLGAYALGDLCGQAQADWRASSDDKRVILQCIEGEYKRIQNALDQARCACITV